MTTGTPEQLMRIDIQPEMKHWFRDESRSEDPEFVLIEVMKGVGYKVQVVVLECEWEKAQRRNLARGPHNISAYYTDEFDVRWLLEAVGEVGGSVLHSSAPIKNQ